MPFFVAVASALVGFIVGSPSSAASGATITLAIVIVMSAPLALPRAPSPLRLHSSDDLPFFIAVVSVHTGSATGAPSITASGATDALATAVVTSEFVVVVSALQAP
jgi:hypothetical protein